MRTSICVFLLFIFLSPLPAAQGKVPCDRGLRDMGVNTDRLKLVRTVPDNHAIFITDKDNLIWDLVHTPGWSPDRAINIDRAFHGGRPSLHCTRHNTLEGVTWELDYDKWEPTATPLNLAAHAFLEVLPHLLFHTATSQSQLKGVEQPC